MVENIYALKNKILGHVEKETQNMERIDVKEVGELVDMVKDLAEAEKSCWEASYYRAVTEAMGGQQQQQPMGYQSRMGYSSQQRGGAMGYSGPYGYSNIVDKLGEEYRNLSQDEKAAMRASVLSTLGAM